MTGSEIVHDAAFWPRPTASEAFAARRRRLARRHAGPLVLAAGFARPRNFAGNPYPFRAESHFLYFVGRHLEGAVLTVLDGRAVVYAVPPDDDAVVWSGPAPSLDELAVELGVDVRPIDTLDLDRAVATLPPQDEATAEWLGHLLGRPVEASGGDELDVRDADLADAVIDLRLAHDAAAIDQLRQAAHVTELAHRAGMSATRPGLREAAVCASMQSAIIAHGMTCSYEPIVTVHGEVLHDERHDRALGEHDLLLADVGAETPDGWAGDVTRTWPTSGRYTATQREMIELVLAAQKAAIATVRPGVRYRDVHHTAARVLVEGLVGLGVLHGDSEDLRARGAAALFFPHGVGHLLGLDVHDMEDLGDRAGYAPGRSRSETPGDRYLRLDRDLQPGMAVTIEPGFYRIPALLDDEERTRDLRDAIDWSALERFADVRGIRIEDDVLVTDDGCEVLTRAIPKEPDDVEAAVRG